MTVDFFHTNYYNYMPEKLEKRHTPPAWGNIQMNNFRYWYTILHHQTVNFSNDMIKPACFNAPDLRKGGKNKNPGSQAVKQGMPFLLKFQPNR